MILVRQAERPYTADDLREMPDDGRRYEVIGGELIVPPSPSERHQRVSFELVRILGAFVTENEIGRVYAAPLDVYLGEHDVVQPDLIVILKANRGIIQPHGIVGVPDLLVEIVSRSTAGIDRVRKAATYATAGVRECWIVDPEAEKMLVQELKGGRYHPAPMEDGLATSKVLEGLRIDPAKVFATPDWLREATE
jgi:Uma2 family endonuclease